MAEGTCVLSASPRIFLNHRHRARMIADWTCSHSPTDDGANGWRREDQALEEPYAPDLACYTRPHGGCLAWKVVWDEDEDGNADEDQPYASKCTLVHGHDGFHYGQEVMPKRSGGGPHGHLWLTPGDVEPERDNDWFDKLRRFRWCANPYERHGADVPTTCPGEKSAGRIRMERFITERCERQGKWCANDRTNPFDATHDCYVVDPCHCLAWDWDNIDVEEGEGLVMLECIYERGHGHHHNSGYAGWSDRIGCENVGDPTWSPKAGKVWWCGHIRNKNCRGAR